MTLNSTVLPVDYGVWQYRLTPSDITSDHFKWFNGFNEIIALEFLGCWNNHSISLRVTGNGTFHSNHGLSGTVSKIHWHIGRKLLIFPTSPVSLTSPPRGSPWNFVTPDGLKKYNDGVVEKTVIIPATVLIQCMSVTDRHRTAASTALSYYSEWHFSRTEYSNTHKPANITHKCTLFRLVTASQEITYWIIND